MRKNELTKAEKRWLAVLRNKARTGITYLDMGGGDKIMCTIDPNKHKEFFIEMAKELARDNPEIMNL